ncbi:chemotaxis protein CheW [Methanocella arvoryzae]|uniref:Chemotaxis signal transducer n=1 Tax=Methanocella arvoryzae (strain DSM 22066 / NBRC 105507 / MRE50) TaxID=351160 RepID=Q0W6D8_METAR|nr:chemotaxis protein CheW [Methanocella arvoryzae]CAJ36055.1 chemotaxis signal transducer [Methanocella arvoryzae MRE50]
MAEDTSISGEMQLVIFKLGTEEFGVDISQVREIIRVGEITRIPGSPRYVDGVINLRGQVTTVVNLRTRLGLDGKDMDSNARIMIMEVNKNVVGVIVDSVTEVKNLASAQIEPLPQALSSAISSEYIQGVGKIDNRLLILVDLKQVIRDDIDAVAHGVTA